MVESEAKDLFSSLTLDNQARFLASLAHHLTVSSRAISGGEPNDRQAIARLLALNEIQQSVTGQLIELLKKSDARYPDDVLIKVLFEEARNGMVESDLDWALGLASRGFTQ